ncbi:MAG: polysaccharide biosynthesis tyrosine autokinase [Cyanobacteria bacterium P01_F01_bin.56]
MVSEASPPQSGIIPQAADQEGGLQIGRFVAAIRRHSLVVIGVTTFTASAAVLKAITDTPVYRGGFELLTPQTTLETQIISTINEEALSNQPDVFSVAIDETTLKILKSPRLMEPILSEVNQQYPNVSYRQLTSGLSIRPDTTGSTLFVEYTSENPDELEYVLEIVSQAYLQYSLDDRQSAIFRGIDFVDEQLPVARQRVEALEGALEELRQNANLIDPLTEGEKLSEQAARFDAEQLDLRVQIKQAQDIYTSLQRELSRSNEFASNSVLQESDRYQALLNQLLEIDSQLAEQLTLYLEGSPEIDVIEERRQNLQPLLEREGLRVQRELANYIDELGNRDRALSSTIDNLNQQIKNLSTTAREYGSIQRELDIASNNLNEFLTKREALGIDAAQRQTPWEILSPPSNPRASSASAKQNLALGVILGLLIGSGAAILLDRLRGKIHTVEELKQAVGSNIPLLGVIPYERLLENGNLLSNSLNQLSRLGFEANLFMPNSPKPNLGESGSTPFFEAFRVLSTNIQLNSPDKQISSFVISSAIPNMGKSTITFYLAYAVAAMGRKVLMVDTDLRRPTLHKLCDISNDKGVSNCVAGEFNPEEVVSDLSLDPNLFLLPAGPVPPDPTKIIMAQRMKELIAFTREEFDLVIFDTPPILGFADAILLSAYTQGMLMTAKLGEIKFSQLQMTLDELSVAKVPLLGIVANDVKGTSQNHYSYYDYYRVKDSDKKGKSLAHHPAGSYQAGE